MQLNSELYDLTQNLQGALFVGARAAQQGSMSAEDWNALQQPLSPLLQVRRGYAESPAWMMVQVEEFDPDPLSVDKFCRRAVYASENIAFAILELLASEQWLDRRADEYSLTPTGRDILRQLGERRAALFANFAPLAETTQRVYDLLTRIIKASMEVDEPPGVWCLRHSLNRSPHADAPAAQKIFQYCADFNAFRDDCHMAAYHPYGVAGHVWESLNLVASESAATVDELYAQLAYRGFTREERAASLGELCGRGWLTADADGRHSITEAGKAVRAEVERLTDDYFYAPWHAALSDAEIDELVMLMTQLHDASQALTNG